MTTSVYVVMKRILLLASLAITIPLFAESDRSHKIREAKVNQIADSYIVVLHPRTDDVDRTAAVMMKDHPGNLKHLYKSALKGFSAHLTKTEAQNLAEDPRVEYVEEDQVITIDTTQSSATWGAAIEVPLIVFVAVVDENQDDVMLTPGAKRSTHDP